MKEKYDGKLWSDLGDDLERSEFIACGRAHETGIIARALSEEVAAAFMFRHEAEQGKKTEGSRKEGGLDI